MQAIANSNIMTAREIFPVARVNRRWEHFGYAPPLSSSRLSALSAVPLAAYFSAECAVAV